MDTQEQPLDCTLEGSELVERIEAWQQVVSRATAREAKDGRLVARYPKDARLLDRLRELIAAEAECCPFLDFSVDERADSIVTELRLPEATPAPMRSLILGLFGAA